MHNYMSLIRRKCSPIDWFHRVLKKKHSAHAYHFWNETNVVDSVVEVLGINFSGIHLRARVFYRPQRKIGVLCSESSAVLVGGSDRSPKSQTVFPELLIVCDGETFAVFFYRLTVYFFLNETTRVASGLSLFRGIAKNIRLVRPITWIALGKELSSGKSSAEATDTRKLSPDRLKVRDDELSLIINEAVKTVTPELIVSLTVYTLCTGFYEFSLLSRGKGARRGWRRPGQAKSPCGFVPAKI